jgi:hypothetical protein
VGLDDKFPTLCNIKNQRAFSEIFDPKILTKLKLNAGDYDLLMHYYKNTHDTNKTLQIDEKRKVAYLTNKKRK